MMPFYLSLCETGDERTLMLQIYDGDNCRIIPPKKYLKSVESRITAPAGIYWECRLKPLIPTGCSTCVVNSNASGRSRGPLRTQRNTAGSAARGPGNVWAGQVRKQEPPSGGHRRETNRHRCSRKLRDATPSGSP